VPFHVEVENGYAGRAGSNSLAQKVLHGKDKGDFSAEVRRDIVDIDSITPLTNHLHHVSNL